MKSVYERPREPLQVAEEDAQEPELDTTPPVAPRPPLLRDLPAHQDGVYVTPYGHCAGAPTKNSGSVPRAYSLTGGFEHYESKRIPMPLSVLAWTGR
ncbi:hypothetical protein PM082_012320 [Marasmius tenuissimus]|nr:hypothetical protein PM082_012320 [Marasmius tenuissimus]